MDTEVDIFKSGDKKSEMRKVQVKLATRKYRSAISKSDKEKIKARDRERKASMMARMSDEEKEKKKEKDRLRRALQRAKQRKNNGNVDDKNDDNDADKPPSYTANEREHNRQYKEKMRGGRNQHETEYDRIKMLLTNRKTHSKLSEEEHQDLRSDAADGMRKFRELGCLKEYQNRSKRSKDAFDIWRSFWKSSDDAKALLRRREPEIAARLSKEVDIDGQENPETDFQIDIEKKKKEWREKNAAKVKAWRKKKRLELQKKLDEPIILPEMEKCEYEKIRDQNIRELEEARKAMGF